MNLENLSFVQPAYLKLLFVPAILFFLCLWRLVVRRANVNKCLRERIVPVGEKYLFAGKLAFWFFLILALGFSILALSRPRSVITVSGNTSVDLVFIFDGSASMRVRDLKPDRWQRSMVWLRIMTEALSWKGDRFALALFASKAYPYIRLTDDPNVVLFFIDHLKFESPLLLQDPKTWDTNIEEGIYWGVKILIRDKQLYGQGKNPQAFVLVSDGQAWSGSMEEVFKIVKRVAPVYVVGVGTTAGGIIPETAKTQSSPTSQCYYDDEIGETICPPPNPPEPPSSSVHASIDRNSLRKIASTTGGQYFELGTASDDQIALSIINSVKKRSLSSDKEEIFEELYWWFILSAAICITVGVFYLYKY